MQLLSQSLVRTVTLGSKAAAIPYRGREMSRTVSDPSEQTSEDSDTSGHENEHDSHGSEEGEARGKRKRVTAPEKWQKKAPQERCTPQLLPKW